MARDYYRIGNSGIGYLEGGKFNVLDLGTLAVDLVRQGEQFQGLEGLTINPNVTGMGAAGQVLYKGGQGTVTEGQLAGVGSNYLKTKYGIDIGSLSEVPSGYSNVAASLSNFAAGAPNIGRATPENTGALLSEAQKKAASMAEATNWVNPATGQVTAAGVGMPAPTSPVGAYIPNEQALQAKRKELAAAGVPQAEWSKFISAPNAQGKIFWNQPATLTSPTGQKKVVASGSQEANQLLGSGWTLGDKVGGGTVTSNLLRDEAVLDIGKDSSSPSYKADITVGGAKADSDAIDAEIKRLQELLTPPETDLSKSVSKLLKDLETGADSLTGRGAAQLSEEEKQGVQAKIQALTAKNGELKTKLAEINALTASYGIANQQEEGRPQTLSRLQGAQAQNYKMYLAQKNLLTSEAAFLQSEALSLAGQADAAQKAADRAVDLLYQDRQDAYNAKLNQLNILLPQLEKEEARYGNAVKLYLENQADALAAKKQTTKEISTLAIQAATNGAPSYVIAKMRAAADAVSAAQIGSSWIKGNMEKLGGGGGGGPVVTTPNLTTDDKRVLDALNQQLSGLGMNVSNFPVETQNFIANSMNATQRQNWINEMVRTQSTIDPITFLQKTNTSNVTVTNAQTQKLIGAGFTQSDIPLILKDIEQNGLDAVLKGLPKNQQDVLKSIFGTKSSSSSSSSMSDEEFLKLLE